MSNPENTAPLESFLPTRHTNFTPATDPSKTKLPSTFVVCIVGASRGIGASIAYSYALAGASTIILAARSSSALQDVAAHIATLNSSTQTVTVSCDITSSASAAALTQTIQSTTSRLDVVVVNSGYSGPVVLKMEDGDPADFQRAFDVNVQGTYLAAHHLMPLLRSTEGGAKAFLAVSAYAQFLVKGSIANTAYCTSKMAQARIVEILFEQYREEGVVAAAVHPGAVKTEMSKGAPEEFQKYLIDDVMLCGSFMVWLTKEKRAWLGGRMLSATWDVQELEAKRKEIEDKDLLKFDYRS